MITRARTAVYIVLRRLYRAFESRFSVLAPRIAEVEAQRMEVDELLSVATAAEANARRTAAYMDRLAEELRAELQAMVFEPREQVAELLAELSNDAGRGPGAELEWRLEHRAGDGRLAALAQGLAELRASVRFTQAMLERQGTATGGEGTGAAGEGTPGPPAASSSAVAARSFDHPVPDFDLLYATFESRMRGSTEEILERQRADYLERLSALPSPELPIVDLGCGRGELVGLLDGKGQLVLGVDSNAAQVAEAGSGEVVEADLFEWLDARDDDSVRAVVALHVVEHLPVDLQVRLVHEARRVLAPGGLMVLETPNVTSLAVGASTFWVDPTHLRPVHPEFLRFLADDAGFTPVETVLLHPAPLQLRGPESAGALVEDLNGLLLGPSDVALVASVPDAG